MIQEDFLRLISGKVLLTSNKTENEFLRANWKRLFAIFDTGPMYNVVDGKKIIGTLDSGFARAQKLPFVFVLGGQEWNTIKLDHEMQQVSVEKNETGIAPKWKCISNYDIPFELAQEVGRLLMNNENLEFLDSPAQLIIQAQRDTHRNLCWHSDKWILESSFEYTKISLWTFAGDKINRTISTLLSIEIEGDLNYDYMKVTIDVGKEEPKSLGDVLSLILSIKSKIEEELENEVEDQIKVIWFSKFSECLPAQLAKKAIREKGIDLPGLIRELNRVKIAH